ncbi:hypothetical protein RDWZM_000376 [Blomia tropicalis]|uniref:Uncharacterized protein n=1 Tax=Blomia tropicalis TaxID=40697 RepID=A0A9Q0RQE7_BLOTA|nr:hypothetical protein BLOT_013934 [Blomia tropicalis]KAJ6221831.1 hypothetical protein RDWZM_000376 [Blomia tropicalis]
MNGLELQPYQRREVISIEDVSSDYSDSPTLVHENISINPLIKRLSNRDELSSFNHPTPYLNEISLYDDLTKICEYPNYDFSPLVNRRFNYTGNYFNYQPYLRIPIHKRTPFIQTFKACLLFMFLGLLLIPVFIYLISLVINSSSNICFFYNDVYQNQFWFLKRINNCSSMFLHNNSISDGQNNLSFQNLTEIIDQINKERNVSLEHLNKICKQTISSIDQIVDCDVDWKRFGEMISTSNLNQNITIETSEDHGYDLMLSFNHNSTLSIVKSDQHFDVQVQGSTFDTDWDNSFANDHQSKWLFSISPQELLLITEHLNACLINLSDQLLQCKPYLSSSK